MAGTTQAENISSERARIINRAISESVTSVPALAALRRGGAGEAGQALQGHYDDDDEWVAWWRAGDTAGSSPVRPQRG